MQWTRWREKSLRIMGGWQVSVGTSIGRLVCIFVTIMMPILVVQCSFAEQSSSFVCLTRINSERFNKLLMKVNDFPREIAASTRIYAQYVILAMSNNIIIRIIINKIFLLQLLFLPKMVNKQLIFRIHRLYRGQRKPVADNKQILLSLFYQFLLQSLHDGPYAEHRDHVKRGQRHGPEILHAEGNLREHRGLKRSTTSGEIVTSCSVGHVSGCEVSGLPGTKVGQSNQNRVQLPEGEVRCKC